MHGVHIKFNIKPKKSRPTSSNCLGYVNGLDNFTQRWFDSSSGHVSDRTSLPIMVPSLIKTEYKTVPSTLQYGVLKPACLTAFIIVRAHSHLCFDRILEIILFYLTFVYIMPIYNLPMNVEIRSIRTIATK